MADLSQITQLIGLRPEWARFAVEKNDGIGQNMSSFPSIQFGEARNELISVQTPNSLYLRLPEMEVKTISEMDLEWYESQSRTHVKYRSDEYPDDPPYHEMAFTRVQVQLSDQTRIHPDNFEKVLARYLVGMHDDIKQAISDHRLNAHYLQTECRRSGAARGQHTKHFALPQLSMIWRNNMLSTNVGNYRPNGDVRNFFGGTGVPEGLTGMFFGQISPDRRDDRNNWICFMSVELFEQLYLTWLDDLTGMVFLRHIEHCGLIIPA
ncbi:MAG: hypothetical protein ACOYUZ_03475 [Patescibacteria group bacterium]